MSISPAEAFDNCPNRTIEYRNNKRLSVCVRYPQGVEAHVEVYHAASATRERFARQLGCVACPHKDKVYNPEQTKGIFDGYHDSIVRSCKSKFIAGHYDDAVFTGILVVRDRLRDLTGYETAAEAFSRGGLVIAGSANSHTENNFQESARFMMMANDKLRNELAHTNDQNQLIKNPGIALQFLGVSSISAFMLDSATVRPS